jgi:DNA replication and repair protein RecF
MQLTRLHLHQFRAYQQHQWELDQEKKLHLIHGANGSGKSTLLEAVYLMVGGRSFRTNKLKEICKFDLEAGKEPEFAVQMSFRNLDIERELYLHYANSRYRLQENGKSLSTLSQLVGKFQAVLLSPYDMSLMEGSPQERRKYLDLLLSQTDPEYLELLVRYHHVLDHYNQLLKQQHLATLPTWRRQLASLGGEIIAKRLRAIALLNPFIAKWALELSVGPSHYVLEYLTPFKETGPEELSQALHQRLCDDDERQKQLGYALSGPHREDWNLMKDGRSMATYASQGQLRSGVILIKISGWSYIQSYLQVAPILLVDDLALSLDLPHGQRLLDLLARLHTQCIITAPHFDQWQIDPQTVASYHLSGNAGV